MFEQLKYIYDKFEKNHMMLIAFCGLVFGSFFLWKWTKAESNKYELVAPLQERLIEKDSIILKLTEQYARERTINEIKNNIK